MIGVTARGLPARMLREPIQPAGRLPGDRGGGAGGDRDAGQLIRRRTLLTGHTRTPPPGARRHSQEIKKPGAASPQGHDLSESAVDFEAG